MADSTSKGVAVTPELRSYLIDHSVPQHAAHADLVAATRETLGDLAIMQIAEEQGPFLTWTTRLLGARRAVEVGTFTGLSALCIAEGLSEDGRLTCFDVNEQFVAVGRPFWERAGVADRIDVVIGPADVTLATFRTDEPIDLAFIDADKPGYRTYYDLILPVLRPGGVIVFDNALYFGAVLTDSTDADVRAIQDLNDHVAADPRVETVLVNVGDGLLLARKL
ncbi:MAG: O-methyltransferase [Acidobacteria bacterium]|nr:O-methyltransferase [Acidobacteriota bacterium]